MDNARDRVAQMLSARAPNMRNNTNPNTNVGLHRIQPQVPPNLTSSDLLSDNIVNYRDSKKFDGLSAYRFACILRAQSQGLNLPFNTISSTANKLWRNEPDNIKQHYVDIADRASHMYEHHHERFSEH
ncbi:hypothetical protein RclHR1_00030009 [Rhizophagus clarus]|uniref:HMG box domain-containing protein n=1 Tax=Rhizophagus clarus TaxID=94130 RepID=A0A2Z6R909_9GLOM|nr:hypothetical protein RclHR1_00030009 [Rhizophagus clarus]GES92303.1 hypothetical protein GLOIN_2v1704711 [Rhizophagus clarus]